MEKFKSFITEAKEPYNVLIVSHDDPEDPNVTGKRIEEECKKMGMVSYMLELDGGYITTNDSSVKVAHNKDDKKGFEMNPEDTLIFVRGSITKRYSWMDMVSQLERAGFCCINSRHCIEVCHDKYRTMLFLAETGLRQPKSILVPDKDASISAFKELGSKYPIILKTVTGTHGVGVMYIESEKSLSAITQILYKLDEDIGLMLQEYIPTKYDVRAIVRNKEVIATMQRPVVPGDFRSNVSQGSKPKTIKLTELEEENCIQAADMVDGLWVGVDFIPAQNREKDQPFIIEINSSPGSAGIEEVSKSNMIGDILEYYKDRTKWLKPKPFTSIYT
jgi:RimK family alpha-L-glutamate ligase